MYACDMLVMVLHKCIVGTNNIAIRFDTTSDTSKSVCGDAMQTNLLWLLIAQMTLPR